MSLAAQRFLRPSRLPFRHFGLLVRDDRIAWKISAVGIGSTREIITILRPRTPRRYNAHRCPAPHPRRCARRRSSTCTSARARASSPSPAGRCLFSTQASSTSTTSQWQPRVGSWDLRSQLSHRAGGRTRGLRIISPLHYQLSEAPRPLLPCTRSLGPCRIVAWLRPNGSRLSCGRLASRRKGGGRSPVPVRARHNGFH